MRIAYVGNFQPRTERGEPFSTESHVAASLELLGHEVIRLQESRMDADVVHVNVLSEKADLLLWTRTWPEKLRQHGGEMLLALRQAGIPTVAYHLDLYAGLPRSRDIDEEPWWRCEYVFTADGGSDDFWRAHGVNHYWIPPGVFGPECYMAPRTYPDGYRYDVVFVGSGLNGYHPEWPYRKELLDWLRATYGDRFHAFGRGGARECVRGAELNQLYADAKVVVGDSLCLGFKHERYWSDRVPETLGRGGFLVHPWIPGMERDYDRPMDHFATYEYGNFAQLKNTIDMYLEHDPIREAIRASGHARARERCTYERRLEEVLATVASLG